MVNNLETFLNKPRVIFRADGNKQIGLGHFTRSLALAYYLKNQFECVFAIQEPAPEIVKQLEENQILVLTLPLITDLMVEADYLNKSILLETDILVLDGYRFDLAYQQRLKEAKVSLVCIDDIQAYPFVADVIINTAGEVAFDKYKALPGTKFYLGPEYALLRQPFLSAAYLPRNINYISRIFLNMGGADPENHTCQLIQNLLAHHQKLILEIVIGSAYIHKEELAELVGNNKSGTIIHQNLDAAAMCALMQQCEAAILPPSSVSYEWCSVGGPLFLHQIADNQEQNFSFLIKNNLAFPFKAFSGFLQNPEKQNIINQQINNQRQWFNGKSPDKLRGIFSELALQKNFTIREGDLADMEILYNWVNDPEVRQNSFNPLPIGLEVHQIWFKNKLKDTNCLIYIAELNKIPAGMVRFDITAQQATISYLIDQKYRGKGLGTLLLEKGLARLISKKPTIEKAIGFIQETNQASIKAFRKNNFELVKNEPSLKPGSLLFEKNLK